ncbi:MAG: SOS response-associated peptidase [Blastocatellia bacterium]
MCGRFVLQHDSLEIADRFGVSLIECPDIKKSYNIAPTDKVAVVIEDGVKKLVQVRWGLIARWTGAPQPRAGMINARAETLASKASFREAFLSQRCLVVADGFFEWRKDGTRKTPIYIKLKSGDPFGFAGLYEDSLTADRENCRTCTIITTEPNELMSAIHNRMPVILPREAEDDWLDPNNVSYDELLGLLKPYPAAEMEAYQVSRRVNSVRNNDPSLIEPAVEDEPYTPSLFD